MLARESLSIVIPTYNEAASLRPLLERIHELVRDRFNGDSEILVVDDGSTDSTADFLRSTGMPLTLITHDRRKGSGAARKSGSYRARGEICAWIDADGTYDPADLLELTLQLAEADQVIGSRGVEVSKPRWLRSTVKQGTAALASALWGVQIPDLNSGLRVFRRQKMLEWLDEVPNGFSCTSTATLAALNHDQRIVFSPVSYQARLNQAPSKFHPAWDIRRLWRAVWHCWIKRNKAE